MSRKFSQRTDLMSMQTIKYSDVKDTRPLEINPRASMRLDDIEGCRTAIPGYKYHNKPVLNLTNQDIYGTLSYEHYSKNIKDNYSLRT